jgi:hypothetical protein
MTLGDRIRAYNHTYSVAKTFSWAPIAFQSQDLHCPCRRIIPLIPPRSEDAAIVVCPKCGAWHVILWREPVSR